MIQCLVADVEVLPNLFSIIFIDLNDYLNKFKDCVDEKGKPVPLTDKYSVEEIKEKLDEVKSDTFSITDYDDKDLLPLASYLNNMSSRYITSVDSDGNIKQEPFRTDLYGYNLLDYDNLMIAYFLMNFNRYDDVKSFITHLYKFSKDIIRQQENKCFENKTIELVKTYRLPYATVDLFKLFHLHSCGVNIDSKTGERRKFGKGLKSVSINLKWHELLLFELPPICDKDIHFYHNMPEYQGLTAEQINRFVSSFDRYIIEEYRKPLLHYNKNDVFICCEMVRQKPDEIRLRYSISSLYKINVLSSARSNIADKLVTKYYSEMSGLHKRDFEKLRTERTKISFSKVIFPHITFKTPELQQMLNDMKKVVITRTNKDAFCKTIEFYKTKYTLATGGIHSEDPPRVLKSTDQYTYVHWDYASYYPSIIISYNVAPKHLDRNTFIKMIKFFRDTRVEAKHTKDKVKQVIQGIPNKIVAEVLKIVINAIYGKLGSDMFFLYDRLAQMQVTINGQLMTMTLVEELELNGIHVVSANTDGIVIKLPNDKKEVFKEITTNWNKANKMSADGEEYKILIARDINNYLDVQLDNTIEYKGAFDPKMYIKDLTKGYDMPIVAKAVSEYFINNIPVMDTLHNEQNILEFCKTQNVGKNFELKYYKVVDGDIKTIDTQRFCRFYVSTKGVRLFKVSSTGEQSRLAGGLPVQILNTLDNRNITTRDIDYKYYYNECFKIINPILLGISPKGKGKTICKKYYGMYNTLFDNDE